MLPNIERKNSCEVLRFAQALGHTLQLKRNHLFTKLHSVPMWGGSPSSCILLFHSRLFVTTKMQMLSGSIGPYLIRSGWRDSKKYKSLERVSERGLEQGFLRSLKMTQAQDIIVFKVRNQRLLSQLLYFGDTDKVKNALNKYPNTCFLLAINYKIESL